MSSTGSTTEVVDDQRLHIRWLGRVRYRDAHALQTGLHDRSRDNYLLLLEHPDVYTLGARGDLGNLLRSPDDVGAELVQSDRGGDVTFHGPGQLVGYPIVTLPGARGRLTDVIAHLWSVEQLVIEVLDDLGLQNAGRVRGLPGVWVDPEGTAPRKICAVGVRVSRGRSMHGFALNVQPDLSMFSHIVPCGISDKSVTSLAAEGVEATMREVVDAVATRAEDLWGRACTDRADVVWRHGPDDLAPFSHGLTEGTPVELSPARHGTTERRAGRLAEAGVTQAVELPARKPDWMRARVRASSVVAEVERTVRDLGLVTVCEEAGCPNLSECWSDGTATFMINGDRCTRACGFCLVDTRHPEPPDPGEPSRVAEAVRRMGLRYAVITTTARDDLPDGGASQFAATIRAIREAAPGVSVEVLISDCKGDPQALQSIFAERPDVLNHNLETVARLQRAARPSAGYARSLAVLARAKAVGLTTKSSLIVGMGETHDEVVQALCDLRSVGVDIVTIGQYLRPTAAHLPVARWWTPSELTLLKEAGESLGISHVEAGPLVRSSYRARQAADSVPSLT